MILDLTVMLHHNCFHYVNTIALSVKHIDRYEHMCPWSTDAVISSTGIFVAITNNTLYGPKLYIFIL